MDFGRLMAIEDKYSSGVAPKLPIMLSRGKGARLWDVKGVEYIDCSSGHGVANLGHANPVIIQAITSQAEKLITASNDFYLENRARLLSELVRIAPQGIERAFLCNSGTEAVEGAIKFARLSTNRTKVISTMRGFHGRTMGSLSATWNKAYRTPFEPLLSGFDFVPYNRLDKIEQVMDGDTAAVILEIVQGEGGVHPAKYEYLVGVQELCRSNGSLLIVDEVQTGYGRTGKMFACEHFNLKPDLMAAAKSIAGGLPMGAVLIGERVGILPKKSHGTTFGGNPLVCAAALATIDFIETECLPNRAAMLGERLMAGLRAIESPLIKEVRGLGLMVGLQLKTRAGEYLAKIAEPIDGLGVLALNAGSTVMRFLPPLVIGENDVDLVIDRVEKALME